MKAVLRNQTGIEDWVLEKAAYRREGTKDVFLHPYNVGLWANLLQVVNWQMQPKGDGIVWDVRENCTQFTFTVRFFFYLYSMAGFSLFFLISDGTN